MYVRGELNGAREASEDRGLQVGIGCELIGTTFADREELLWGFSTECKLVCQRN